MATLAIIKKEEFEKNASEADRRPGVILHWHRYWSNHQLVFETAGAKEPLYLVTVRNGPAGERLWLVAVFPQIELAADEAVMQSPSYNSTPITDITVLRENLEFSTGNGLSRISGRLAQSLQTPRRLTTKDIDLICSIVKRDANLEKDVLNSGKVHTGRPQKPTNAKGNLATKEEVLSGTFVEESDLEGIKTEILVTKVGRSRKLRDHAFTNAGGICCVCKRDYSKVLAGRGVRVLQVHHCKQLAALEAPSVTKLSDLVVVCANCHLLLHLDKNNAMGVTELRELLEADERTKLP